MPIQSSSHPEYKYQIFPCRNNSTGGLYIERLTMVILLWTTQGIERVFELGFGIGVDGGLGVRLMVNVKFVTVVGFI